MICDAVTGYSRGQLAPRWVPLVTRTRAAAPVLGVRFGHAPFRTRIGSSSRHGSRDLSLWTLGGMRTCPNAAGRLFCAVTAIRQLVALSAWTTRSSSGRLRTPPSEQVETRSLVRSAPDAVSMPLDGLTVAVSIERASFAVFGRMWGVQSSSSSVTSVTGRGIASPTGRSRMRPGRVQFAVPYSHPIRRSHGPQLSRITAGVERQKTALRMTSRRFGEAREWNRPRSGFCNYGLPNRRLELTQ